MPVVGKFLNVAYGGIALQPVDRIQPLAVIHGLYAGQQLLQYFTQISNQRHVHFYVLVDFGRIDLDVNLLGILSVGLQVARNPVVKAHAEGEQQVGLLNRMVDPGFSVHPHHAEIQRMGSRKRSQPQ